MSAGLLAEPERVREILISAAAAGEAVTYSEVLNALGHEFTRPKMRALCKVLAVIDDEANRRVTGILALSDVMRAQAQAFTRSGQGNEVVPG